MNKHHLRLRSYSTPPPSWGGAWGGARNTARASDWSPSPNPSPRGRGTGIKSAFTLIELLVVVTIIVVLLALLVPAMDKAIYQAELVVCASRHNALANGVLIYAADHRRAYPNRPTIRAGSNQAQMITHPDHRDTNGGQLFDDRPYLRDHIPFNKVLQCPLTTGLDLDTERSQQPDAYVCANYALFYGWSSPYGRGMKRLGDRWASWDMDFSFLSADLFQLRGGSVVSGHPDSRGRLTESVQQDSPSGGVVTAVQAEASITQATWGGAAVGAGTFDFNTGYADGSVRRLDRVEPQDERMTYIHYHMDDATHVPNDALWVPKE